MRGEVSPDPGVREFDLLVLGEVNADVILSGDVDPAFGQEEHLVDDGAVVLGGSGAITACGAARLGLRVAYAGLAGDDALGRFCLDELAAAGVDVSAVQRRAGLRTGVGVLLVREDGDRAILTYPGAIPFFSASDVDPAVAGHARHLHVGAYFLQTGLHASLASLFSAHRASGGTTSLDPNWDPSGAWELGDLLSCIDYLLPNAAEADRLAPSDSPEMAAALLAGFGPTVAVKLGACGALFHDGGAPTKVRAPAVDAVSDAVGAGDNFDAGFLAAALAGDGPEAALALGCACGALSMRGVGGTARQPDRREAEALAATILHGRGSTQAATPTEAQ